MYNVLLGLLVICIMFPGLAQATPDDDLGKLPIIQSMKSVDTKFYPLGDRFSLPGWLILRNGKIQMLYLTPDKKGIILGAIHSGDGGNVTMLQVAALVKSNPELAAYFEQLAKEKNPAGATAPGDGSNLGEKLFVDMTKANGVVLGDGKAPLLHMVIDPRCPYCKATWKELRDDVAVKRLQVHLIPIGAEGSDNEREAARFLEIDAPLENWNKFIDGDEAVLAGIPDPAKLEAVRANHRTIDEWKIQHTPYLVYRGKDGRVKIVQGQPDNIASVLADLQP
jgi:hypothetical protein